MEYFGVKDFDCLNCIEKLMWCAEILDLPLDRDYKKSKMEDTEHSSSALTAEDRALYAKIVERNKRKIKEYEERVYDNPSLLLKYLEDHTQYGFTKQKNKVIPKVLRSIDFNALSANNREKFDALCAIWNSSFRGAPNFKEIYNKEGWRNVAEIFARKCKWWLNNFKSEYEPKLKPGAGIFKIPTFDEHVKETLIKEGLFEQ